MPKKKLKLRRIWRWAAFNVEWVLLASLDAPAFGRLDHLVLIDAVKVEVAAAASVEASARADVAASDAAASRAELRAAAVEVATAGVEIGVRVEHGAAQPARPCLSVLDLLDAMVEALPGDAYCIVGITDPAQLRSFAATPLR